MSVLPLDVCPFSWLIQKEKLIIIKTKKNCTGQIISNKSKFKLIFYEFGG